MPIHTLRATQVVPAPLQECWAFFSDPRNLANITPPSLGFKVISDLPETIRPGLMIEYRVRPLFGIPVTWLTEITHANPPHSFVDEQRIGPYAVWHHEHFFRATEDGGTEIRDEVHYALPFGWVSEIVHPWLVKPQLEQIFAFREKAVREKFGSV